MTSQKLITRLEELRRRMKDDLKNETIFHVFGGTLNERRKVNAVVCFLKNKSFLEDRYQCNATTCYHFNKKHCYGKKNFFFIKQQLVDGNSIIQTKYGFFGGK